MMPIYLLKGSIATDNTAAPVAKATGSITTVTVANLVDGETFTIKDLKDGNLDTYVFEIDKTGNGVAAGNIQVNVSTDTTADHVRDRIVTAINATAIRITASGAVAATVALLADEAGPDGNQTITETVANAGFIVAGMSGATSIVQSPWAASGQGVYLPRTVDQGYPNGAGPQGFLALNSTAGTTPLTATIRIWGLHIETEEWYPLGIGDSTLRGLLNGGSTIVEIDVVKHLLQHIEVVDGIYEFKALYAQIVTLGGTGTAVNLALGGRHL